MALLFPLASPNLISVVPCLKVKNLPSFLSRVSERKWNCIVKSFGEQGCLETFVYRLHKSSQPILSTVPRFWEREQDPIHEGMDDPSFLQNINL